MSRTAPPPAVPASLRVECEGLRGAVLHGWAWDAAEPAAHIRLLLTIVGEPALAVTADKFRADLAEAGIGDGHHAFAALLPRHAMRRSAIDVEIALADGPSILSKRFAPGELPEVEGFVEELDTGHAFGWAWHPRNAVLHAGIEVLADDQIVATGTADNYRADLVDAGVGTGQYGFDIPLLLDHVLRREVVLSVREATTLSVLNRGSLAVVLGPLLQGNVDSVTPEGIVGWVHDARQPDAGLAVEVRVDGRLVGVVHTSGAVVLPDGRRRPNIGYRLPADVLGLDRFILHLAVSGTAFVIPPGPRQIHFDAAAMLVGCMDPVRDYALRGWAVDTRALDRPLDLDLLIDGVKADTIATGKVRRDIDKHFKSITVAGYEHKLPNAVFDGRDHTIDIRFAGTAKSLTNVPFILTAAALRDGLLSEILRIADGLAASIPGS